MKLTKVLMLLACTVVSTSMLIGADYKVQTPSTGDAFVSTDNIFGAGRGPRTAPALSGFGHYNGNVVISESTTFVNVTNRGFWGTVHVPPGNWTVFGFNNHWFSIIGPGKRKLGKVVVNGIDVDF